MITLTTSINVPSELGSAATTAYNKLRIVSITADPNTLAINALVQLLVSANAAAPIISGNLSIITTGPTPTVSIQIPSLNFYSGFALSGASLTAVQGWINTLQNNVESGLISISMVAGTQSTGV